MISLKESFSELDRLESLQRASSECYRSAIEASGQYAVEIDPDETKRFRQDLEAIARQAKAAETAESLRQTHLWFRDELQNYSAKARRYLHSLREKVSASARALTEIVETAKRLGGQSDQKLEVELDRLRNLAQAQEVAEACPELRAVVATVEEAVNQLRKRSRLMVAQLRSEIHSLHQALESARQAAGRDPITGVLNRAEILIRIRQEMGQQKAFCLIFVWISSYEYVHRRYGWHVADRTLAAFCERLRGAMGEETSVGRWGDDRFVVLLRRSKPEAMWTAENLVQQLAGPYVVREGELAREVLLQLKTGVVECAAGTSEAQLLSAADKLLVALETVASTND